MGPHWVVAALVLAALIALTGVIFLITQSR